MEQVLRPGVLEQEAACPGPQRLEDVVVEVVSAAAVADEQKKQSEGNLAFLGFFLGAFAVVSLVVGSMVIANAFAITAAQQARETALLRALGARRAQVSRSVVTEAAVVGIVASALGVGLGVATARLLQSVVEMIGIPLPEGPVAVSGQTVAIGLLVGTAVTVLASYLPARRAGRTAPVAALREAEPGSGARTRRRAVLGGVLGLLGAGLTVSGLTGGSAARAGGGSALCFVALVVLGPVIAPAAVRMLAAPFARLGGVTGVLATQNALRNPRRTAATAASLTVGLGVISFLLMLGTSARASFGDRVDDALRGDWIVSTVFGQGGVSPQLARDIDRLPEAGAVSPLGYTVGEVDGRPVDISGTDTARIGAVIDADLQAGQLADVGPHGIAIRDDVAHKHGWSVGDTVTVGFPETGSQRFTVAAVYAMQDPLGPYSVAMSTLRANTAEHVDSYVFVSGAPGVSRDEASAAIGKVLADYPTAKLQTGPEFAAVASSGISDLIHLMDALLALAVLIALFGIMNTLALSVHEHTREFGLLRAVGMDRRQVRSAVRMEAVVVSMFGTLTGLLAGTGAAAAVLHAMRGDGFRIALPIVSLAVVLLVGALAGVACATIPARRAARVDVLRALCAD